MPQISDRTISIRDLDVLLKFIEMTDEDEEYIDEIFDLTVGSK